MPGKPKKRLLNDGIPTGILKVGKTYAFPNGRRKMQYRDVMFDGDGWATADKYLPEDYDMTYMRCDNERTIAGWCVGAKWSGIRLTNQKVVAWKRKPDVEDEPKQWTGLNAFESTPRKNAKQRTAKVRKP